MRRPAHPGGGRADPEEEERLWPRLEAVYSYYPDYRARAGREIPIVLLEPNAIPGRVNRLTAWLARSVFLGFDAARAHLPARVEKICVGMPVMIWF